MLTISTDAGAGQDEQEPSEAHPDTLLIQNPSAALLDYLFLPSLLLHGAWHRLRGRSKHDGLHATTPKGVSECGSRSICAG